MTAARGALHRLSWLNSWLLLFLALLLLFLALLLLFLTLLLLFLNVFVHQFDYT